VNGKNIMAVSSAVRVNEEVKGVLESVDE